MTPDQREQDVQAVVDTLTDWWLTTAQKDVQACARKAAEYGSVDLELMGAAMLAMNPELWAAAPADERAKAGTEMAIAFYISGKVARLIGAFQQGRLPSEDTIADLVVYSMMLRRAHTAGSWP